MRARIGVAVLVACVATGASAQTMLDQELRLIDIHNLLLDMPPLAPPGALASLQPSLSLEGITVPPINGQTGSKVQITASDHTPLFVRPRLLLGLPAPEGFRAHVGATYFPPIQLLDVVTHLGGLEAGIAYVPGRLAIGVRLHAVLAHSTAPVTDPTTRDTLDSFLFGGELMVAHQLGTDSLSWTPYAGVGLTRLHGSFTVTSDNVVLESNSTVVALDAGVRVLLAQHWEGVLELDAYPDRLIHPTFRIGYVF